MCTPFLLFFPCGVFQAIGVFLEEDNAVGALAKGQLGGFVGRRSVNHTAAGDVMI